MRTAADGDDARQASPLEGAGGGPGGASARSNWLSGLLAVVLWGLAPVATRAVVARLSPFSLLALRIPAAAVLLLPWAVPVFRRLDRRHAGRLVAAGTLGLLGYNLPVTVGLQWIRASTAGLLLGTEPLWVALFAWVLARERVAGRTWVGGATALAGVGAITGPAALSATGGVRALAGIGLVLLGTAAFGAYTVVLRPLSDAIGALGATAASTVVGAVPYLAMAGTLSSGRLAHLPGSAWADLAFLAGGSTVVGLLAWNRAVLGAGSTGLSHLLYLEPLVSVLGAAAFLGESLSASSAAGGVLILGGVLVAGGLSGRRVWARLRSRRSG